MPDIYLCGNRSNVATDITLRGTSPCAVAPTASPIIRRRNLRGSGRLAYRLSIYGVAVVEAAGTLELDTQPTGQPARSGTHTTTLALDGAGTVRSAGHAVAVTVAAHTTATALQAAGALRMETRTHVTPDESDDLLAIFDLIT